MQHPQVSLLTRTHISNLPPHYYIPSSCPQVQVRQYAAVLLRKKFSKGGSWLKLSPGDRAQLKAGCLSCVQAEPERFGITAYSHPIRGKASQVTGQSLEQHISDYSLSLLMAVVLTFLPASSIIYLIEERTTEQKLVQRTYKAGPLTYWTAVFLWDLCRDLLFLSLAALVIFLFQVRSFTANQNLGASLVLMLLYCTASNSLVYLLEKCFREPSMGQIIVLTSFIFTSLLTSITMLMLTMFWWIRPLQKAKEVLEIFLLIFPPYALSKSDSVKLIKLRTIFFFFRRRFPQHGSESDF